MPTYISPTGNSEIWGKKPTDYYTFEEWEKDKKSTQEIVPIPAPNQEEALVAARVAIEIAKTTKLDEIMTAYSAAFAPFKVMYPDEEREGWTEQKTEALAYLADPSAPVPVLTELVRLRNAGETIAEFAQLVLTKSEAWKNIYANLTGQQQRMSREVENLKTVEAVLAYSVTYSLPEGI